MSLTVLPATRSSAAMRVLTIVSNFGRRGTQRVAENFSCGYAALGHDVAVLAFENSGPRLPAYAAAGVTVLPSCGDSLEKALGAAHAFHPSLIHIHRSGVGAARETLVLRALKGPHNCVLETNVFSRFDAEADPYIDLHAQLTRPGLYRWARLENARSGGVGFYLPNVLDYEVWQAPVRSEVLKLRELLGIPSGATVVGTIGKTHPGLGRVVEQIVSEVASVHWVAVENEVTRRIVSKLPGILRGNCRLLPSTDCDATLKTYYGLFDLLLHYSPNGESFGMVLAESIAVGTPVVTPLQLHRDIGGVEVLRHEEGGLIAGSSASLANACHIAIERLPELRRNIVQAQARHQRDYDRIRVAERALDAAQVVLGMPNNRNERRSELSRQGFEVEVPQSAMNDLVSRHIGSRSTWEKAVFVAAHNPTFNDLRRSAQRLTLGFSGFSRR